MNTPKNPRKGPTITFKEWIPILEEMTPERIEEAVENELGSQVVTHLFDWNMKHQPSGKVLLVAACLCGWTYTKTIPNPAIAADYGLAAERAHKKFELEAQKNHDQK